MDPTTEAEIARAVYATTTSTQTQVQATQTQAAKPVSCTTQAAVTATPATQDATPVYHQLVAAVDSRSSSGVEENKSNLVVAGTGVAKAHDDVAPVSDGRGGRWSSVRLKDVKELAPAEAEYWQIKLVLGRLKSGWRGYDAIIRGEHHHY